MTSSSSFLQHPRGLFYLFFAELWERFSFYGMRALLTLYMTKELFVELPHKESFSIGIYASYGALVYTTPLLGGFVADKFLGYSRSVMLGAIFMVIGHFIMAFENLVCFYTALALLIVGNGFFKPNISSILGSLYAQGDAKRDAGFGIFYMAINIGAMLSPIVCGWIAEEYGWHYGFGLAGIGMLIGLLFFQSGRRKGAFGDYNFPVKSLRKPFLVYTGAILLVPLVAVLLVFHQSLGYLLNTALGIAIISLIFMGFKLSKAEISRIVVILILAFFVTIFWAFFEQGGSSLTLFADKNVRLVGINASQTNSINPFFIVLLTFPFSTLWVWLDRKDMNPSIPLKFSLGIFQLGIGFGIFAASALWVDATGKVPMLFLLAGYFFITTGELCLSPVGLSMVTKLSPAQMTAFMMGIWFLASAFAHHLGGWIGKLTTRSASDFTPQNTFDVVTQWIVKLCTKNFSVSSSENFESLHAYTTVFVQIALIAMVVGFVIAALTPLLKKMMYGVK
ncbi:MAG: peptide MFS transporter [Cytophagales bacterium]|nr:peptide MFS transporter [Cytophagales bacterium]MDW8384674.1 peptide MFS transporter [Flammeovirgaceae bacterium]